MTRNKLIFFSGIVLIALALSSGSCTPDPEIITNTIIERDTVYVTQQDTLVLNLTDTLYLTDTVTLTEFIRDTTTTFILVRHAETTGAGSNPGLSQIGMTRAAELERILRELPLTAIYSTDFNRTQETAEPTSESMMLPIESYNPSNLNAFIDQVLDEHLSEVVLVVGHSNTTPDLLNRLTGSNNFPNISEMEYDNLFVVSVLEKGRATVNHLKYGD